MNDLQRLESAFQGKRVFLTGHTGFKGAWLVALLEQLGAETTAYSLPPETEPSLYRLLNGDRLCRSIIGDLRDRDGLTTALRDARPDFVLHLAAQSLVRRSYRDPVDTFESNFLGTMNVLEALRHYDGNCAAVMITTDKVYAESGLDEAYVEGDRLGGHDPYSTSKAACELLVESYRKSFFDPSRIQEHGKAVATARAGNVIGGGDWCEDRLLPDIVRALGRSQSIRVRNPNATRPWQHVLEPLAGYLLLAAHLAQAPARFARPFNFGPDEMDVLPVERVVRLAIQAWGDGTYHVDSDPDAPHEAALLRINSDLARSALRWTPRWDASEAIRQTVGWYRNAMNDPLGYTRGQIQAYFHSDVPAAL